MRSARLATAVFILFGVVLGYQACGGGLEGDGSTMRSLSFGSKVGFDTLSSQIFAPKCVGCHADFATYSGMMAKNVVTSGNAKSSILYVQVSTGMMPKGGP